MADWDFGYITDLAYVHDFCRVQTPPMLALAVAVGGVRAGSGERDGLGEALVADGDGESDALALCTGAGGAGRTGAALCDGDTDSELGDTSGTLARTSSGSALSRVGAS